MVLAAINDVSVAERSLTEVREILTAATRQISEENALKLCFIPRQSGCLYYGGVHGHVKTYHFSLANVCLCACSPWL
jgi:hypothetical protein